MGTHPASIALEHPMLLSLLEAWRAVCLAGNHLTLGGPTMAHDLGLSDRDAHSAAALGSSTTAVAMNVSLDSASVIRIAPGRNHGNAYSPGEPGEMQGRFFG
jgi:hypothetical protein